MNYELSLRSHSEQETHVEVAMMISNPVLQIHLLFGLLELAFRRIVVIGAGEENGVLIASYITKQTDQQKIISGIDFTFKSLAG